MITPAQDMRTTAATHLALIGASSPAFTFQRPSDKEKYRTAIPPIVIKMIFGTKVISFQVAGRIGVQNKHSAEDIHDHPKTPKGSNRCTAENDTDFQKPSTRSETASAVPKHQREAEEMHGLPWRKPDDMVDQ